MARGHSPAPLRAVVAALALLTGTLLAGCTPVADAAGPATSPADPAACPAAPVDVVVSVAQWGDLARALGGPCATVTTVLASPAVDPHDFEPTPRALTAFDGAAVVLLDGAGYDAWAADAVGVLDTRPRVVDAAAVVGASPGDDPHLWYSPDAVDAVGRAYTAALTAAAPGAADAFRAAAASWQEQLRPYRDEVAAVRAAAAGRTYAATETVFDRMAAAVGLTDATPAGYRAAASNESEPSPGDVAALQALLRTRQVDVLVVNTQTEGSVPEQLRRTAEQAGVPVVAVTESPPAAGVGFVPWQAGQLRALATALGGAS